MDELVKIETNVWQPSRTSNNSTSGFAYYAQMYTSKVLPKWSRSSSSQVFV